MFVLVVQYCMSNFSSGLFQRARCSVRNHKLLRGTLFKGFGPWVLWDYCPPEIMYIHHILNLKGVRLMEEILHHLDV